MISTIFQDMLQALKQVFGSISERVFLLQVHLKVPMPITVIFLFPMEEENRNGFLPNLIISSEYNFQLEPYSEQKKNNFFITEYYLLIKNSKARLWN